MKNNTSAPLSNPPLPPFTPDRYIDEYKTIGDLARTLPWDAGRATRVIDAADDLLKRAGTTRAPMGGIEEFLKQYPLSTPAGLSLVTLAEALLRIPDNATAIALINEKILNAGWVGQGAATSDALVWFARYGLGLTKGTLSIPGLKTLAAPVILRAFRLGMRRMGRQFVMGSTVTRAIQASRSEMKKGYALSFDMLGEGARTDDMADRYFNSYKQAIHDLAAARHDGTVTNPQTGISVKLSALHPRYTPLHESICRTVVTERLLALAQDAKRYNLTLTVDAEETERLTLSLQIIADVAAHDTLDDWQGFGLAVQAYQKYAPELIDHVIDMSRATRHRLRIRLVKGAYWDSEIKRAQNLGLKDYPVFTRKINTDLSYLTCAHKLLSAGDSVYPMFATHNAHTVAAVLDLAAGAGRGGDTFEFQRLHGMGGPVHDVLLREGRARSTIYAPVGTHEDLLAYLVRRLIENGANASFVKQAAMGNTALSLKDPIEAATHHTTRRHQTLPIPRDLFSPVRVNSRGVDITQFDERISLLHAPAPYVDRPRDTDTAGVNAAITSAHSAFQSWNNMPATIRADKIDRYATLIEDHMGPLIHLLQDEGRKTIWDAVNEVREAVDFARYYAAQSRTQFDAAGTLLPGPTGEENRLVMGGRGVFACISPWNFPLAIFSGQITAALAAGNTVVAKPAEQTPRIAAAAVDLMHRAGIPNDAVRLVFGDGCVGGMITAHDHIAGVAFTGSTDVARIINRMIAAKNGPIVPLIAETGGQNAMIVDSTALLETACDDIIHSAFGSAGQRCSALRVLYVQNDIADRLIGLITGAVATLNVGDPVRPDTDVGPVIDEDARAMLIAHTQYLDSLGARVVARASLDPRLVNTAPFFAPIAYEIKSIDQLRGEVFGPVLHIIRYEARDLDAVIDAINSTGFGLTFGLQTRLSNRVNDITTRVAAGNIYVNRTQIGAVVGVQPFGGQGLSGTGPKAGGPHYLARFASEKVISVNTAASGGNVALVSSAD